MKVKRSYKKPLRKVKDESEKVILKPSKSFRKQRPYPVPSVHGNRLRNSENSVRLYFWGSKSPQMVTVTKLKTTTPEEKL